MKISLPESLRTFIDEQVEARGYHSSSEYVCDLILADRDRQKLRQLLLDAVSSPMSAVADDTYFEGLRKRVRQFRAD